MSHFRTPEERAADRAAVLREAAEAVAADTDIHIRYGSATDYANRHADLLRRMADDGQQPDTETLPTVTEYRLEARIADTWTPLAVPNDLDTARRIGSDYRRGDPDAKVRILRCTRTAVIVEEWPDVSGPRAAGDKQDGA